ncbi:MAG TPA: hypothetical protein VKB39_05620 [Candidatus Baltobacteraceae bacterium]|nr:hypothetical protein [Candidatus Baltobacteraceae bacterium]
MNLLRAGVTGTALGLALAISGCTGGGSRSQSATQDTYHAKLGIWDHDIAAFKNADIASCREGRLVVPDFMNPPSDPEILRAKAAGAFADCRRAIVTQHLGKGVLRVNDVYLGSVCAELSLRDRVVDLPEPCDDESVMPLTETFRTLLK